MKSLCSKCNAWTNQTVLFEKLIEGGDGEWWEEDKYQIIQCAGCDTISYRTLHNDIQQNYYAEYQDPWTQVVYPKRNADSLPVIALLNTPNAIKRIYRETIDAYNNDQYTLCAAGLRAIIEGISNDKAVTNGEVISPSGKKRISRGLEGKIEGLCSGGFITKTNSEILHKLRFLGNEAIHELAIPSEDELKLAIEIIEHSIVNIYELQHKAKELESKKIIRKRKTSR